MILPAATTATRLHDTATVRAASAVVLVAMGVAIALVGWYGHNHGQSLIPHTTDAQQVPHRLAVIRRGSVACMLVGTVLAVAAVIVGVS